LEKEFWKNDDQIRSAILNGKTSLKGAIFIKKINIETVTNQLPIWLNLPKPQKQGSLA
jgi:hypothetical protein